MVIFHSYVSHYQRVSFPKTPPQKTGNHGCSHPPYRPHSAPAHCCRPPDRPAVRWTGRRVPTCRRGRLRTRSPWAFPWWNTVDYQVLMEKNGTNGSCNDKHIEFIMGHEFPRNPQKKITMSSFPISFYAIIFPWDFHLSQVSPILWGFFHVMLPCYIEHARAAPCERLTKTFKAKDLASKKKPSARQFRRSEEWWLLGL